MTIDQLVFRVAGTMIIASVALAFFHHIGWLGLTLFVGLNMLQASFTKFCPMATIAKKLGLKPGAAFYPPSVQAAEHD